MIIKIHSLSIVVIGAIVMTLLGSQLASASTGFTGDDFTSIRDDRPAINPDFDPDEDCDFDTCQLKCIPGSQQDCPDGFWKNEDDTCHVAGPCPDGYHSVDDDESGQCYPNEGGCEYDYFILIEREDGSYRCAALYSICGSEEFRNENFCIELCEEDPGWLGCRPEAS